MASLGLASGHTVWLQVSHRMKPIRPHPLTEPGQILKECPDMTGCVATLLSSWDRRVDREGGERVES